MRLVFVSHSLPPSSEPMSNVGGMQRVASELHEAFSVQPDSAYDALLLRSSWRANPWLTPFFLLRVAVVLWWRARRGSIDVVLFSSMVSAVLAVPLRRTLQDHGIRTVAIVHGLDVTTPFGPWQWLVRRAFLALDLVLPVSAATGEVCVERGLERDRLRPVRNGVDTGRFGPLVSDPLDRRELLRTRWPLPVEPGVHDGLVLASVGRHVRRKGFEWFVRSVMPLLPDDVQYWLAGDGPDTANIEAAIRETGMTDRVRLLGRIDEDELDALYRGADLFVMPNMPVPDDMEGFGVVMLEAGLAGMATVGARLEGIAEVISEGRNGHLVESGDEQAFVERIMQYHGRPDLRALAARRARAHTADRFNWTAVASEYQDVLAALTDQLPQVVEPVPVRA